MDSPELTVFNDLTEVIHAEGSAQFPNEACGLVIDIGGKGSVARPCRNVSREPQESFLLSPSDHRNALKEGKIIGVWHTHPKTSSMPSPADLEACEDSGVPWYIASVRKTPAGFTFSDVNTVVPSGFVMPYEGRPYLEGVFDCFGLLRDYYRREYGISITNYPRVEDDGTMGYTRFLERYEKEGFVKMIDKKLEPGDVLLMQLFEHIVNHIAIYIGNNRILHHNRGRLSKQDIYGGYWQKCASVHLRHQSKC